MDAVFFDMDGVLVDSVRHKRDNWHRLVVDDLGIDVDVGDLVGLAGADKYAHLREHADVGIDQSTFVDRLSACTDGVYDEHADLLPCFLDLAADLRGRGLHVGLVSAAGRDAVDTVVDRFDLAGTLDVVVSADDVDGPSKPDPAQYEHAVSRLGVTPERTLAVEDSRHGATAVKRAGLYCIGYAPDHHPADHDLSVADELATDSGDLHDRVLAAVDRG